MHVPSDPPEDTSSTVADEEDKGSTTEGSAKVAKRDPSGGPTTVDWWLDDGPDSPIAADIKEPEKHL